MANKGILTALVLILSLSLSGPSIAQSRESEDSKRMVFRDAAALQKVDPLKCPTDKECLEKSQIDNDFGTVVASSNALIRTRLLLDLKKGNNSEISKEPTERTMADAPVNLEESGVGRRPSKSKGRPKGDKKLKRKNRRRKCRERRRKRKLERKMRKGAGKVKNSGKGMGKRRERKGKKNKKRRKCGKVRRKSKKDRKKRKNGRKRKNKKTNIGNGIDTSNKTRNSILDSISDVQKNQKEDTVDINVIESGIKDMATTSKYSDTNSSPNGQKSILTTRRTDARESRGKEGIDSNIAGVGDRGSSGTSKSDFDATQITVMFQKSLLTDSNGHTFVNFQNYVKAYRRLASVFHFFGPIFSFAKADLEEKIDILGQLRSSSIQGQDGENYDTFKTMFEYEYSNGIARPGGHGTSGVRENAWIHRALKFIIAIIRTIADKTDTSPLSGRVKKFYSEILAPHHSWVVRMGVYAAIYSFPSRETLLNDMKITDDAKGMRELTRLSESLQTVYDLIQRHYEKFASRK